MRTDRGMSASANDNLGGTRQPRICSVRPLKDKAILLLLLLLMCQPEVSDLCQSMATKFRLDRCHLPMHSGARATAND